MSELPPDPARLRAILAHLDQQLADTDTLRTYLHLQREEVQRALQAAARQPTRPQRQTQRQTRPALAPAPLPSLAERHPNGPTGAGDGYMLEIKSHPRDPGPAVLHVDSCTRASRKTSPITPDEFRVALRDARVRRDLQLLPAGRQAGQRNRLNLCAAVAQTAAAQRTGHCATRLLAARPRIRPAPPDPTTAGHSAAHSARLVAQSVPVELRTKAG